FDALEVVVFVDGIAEVTVIVGKAATFFFDGMFDKRVGDFGKLELAWRGGKADLNGLRVVLKDFVPFSPRGAMAFIDDDDIKITRRVMLQEKAGVLRVTIRGFVQCLIGRDEYPRVFLRVMR